MINHGLKMLKRAIDRRPKGGMQTGMPKVMLREADVIRAVAELEWAKQRIADLEALVPKWISVHEKLPKNNQDCLICWAGEDDVFEAEFSASKDGKYWSFECDGESWNPTHWMPMPQPPKEVS